MIPVFQTIKHNPEGGAFGDCHRAVWASLLELPIDEVPHFFDGRATSEGQAIEREFLAKRGLMPLYVAWPGETNLDDVLTSVRCLNPGVHFILGGTSRTGVGHSVIGRDGVIVWDPSLTQSGIVGPMEDGLWWVTFVGARLALHLEPESV